MAQDDTQKPLPYLVRKTVIGGGITHASLVAGRSISQYVYNTVTPLLAAGIDFAHVIPEVVFWPFFAGTKLVSHIGLLLGRGGISLAIGATKLAQRAVAHLPEGGKFKAYLADKFSGFITYGEYLKEKYKEAHKWVRDNISPKALGEWVGNKFKKAEMGLFRLGANRSPLASFGIMLGIIGVVAPVTMFGGVLTHALSFALLNGTPAGYLAFLGANAAATLLPKFKLFLAPLYMGCAVSMSKTDLGRKALRWFDHVYKLDIFKDADKSYKGISHALTEGKLGFMKYAQLFPWKERWKQRLAIGTFIVAGVATSPLFALGTAALLAAPVVFKYAKDKASAFLSEKIYGDTHVRDRDASEKLGGLVTHTIETYTFHYYYKKDPSLFKDAPPELLKFLEPAAAAHEQAQPAALTPENHVIPSNVIHVNSKRASMLRDWSASALAVTKKIWAALPKTAAELGNDVRAAGRSFAYYTTASVIAAPIVVLGGALAYVATHAPSTYLVGKPLEALLTSLTHHSGGHFAHSVGSVVAGTLSIPGAAAGLASGSAGARGTVRTALFGKAARETALTSENAKNAEARLICDGAVTGLVAAGVLFVTGSLPIAAAVWGTSAVISMVRNHTGMKEPSSASRPSSSPTPLPVATPQAA